jgi:hypothetical protein
LQAWDYDEMPGLDRQFIEHRLPIKENGKQPPRRMANDRKKAKALD